MTEKLTDLQRKALEYLAENSSEEWCIFAQGFAVEAGISIYKARKAFRELRGMGYSALTKYLTDEDTGLLHGSGHHITEAGLKYLGDTNAEA